MKPFMFVMLLILVFVAACASAPTPTPLPLLLTASSPPTTPTPISTPTATPIPPIAAPTPNSFPKIKTAAGTVVIKEIKIVEKDAFGNQPKSGYKILLIWFEGVDGEKIDGGAFFTARKGVYIIADDGSKTESYTGGLVDGRLVVGFTPPATAKKFTLYWQDNPPIPFTVGTNP